MFYAQPFCNKLTIKQAIILHKFEAFLRLKSCQNQPPKGRTAAVKKQPQNMLKPKINLRVLTNVFNTPNTKWMHATSRQPIKGKTNVCTSFGSDTIVGV